MGGWGGGHNPLSFFFSLLPFLFSCLAHKRARAFSHPNGNHLVHAYLVRECLAVDELWSCRNFHDDDDPMTIPHQDTALSPMRGKLRSMYTRMYIHTESVMRQKRVNPLSNLHPVIPSGCPQMLHIEKLPLAFSGLPAFCFFLALGSMRHAPGIKATLISYSSEK